eukprot:scaffold51359_cov28-Prasinocladus_malaysianus.AAC.1
MSGGALLSQNGCEQVEEFSCASFNLLSGRFSHRCWCWQSELNQERQEHEEQKAAATKLETDLSDLSSAYNALEVSTALSTARTHCVINYVILGLIDFC